MANDEEVIDVDEFHRNLQRNSDASWKRRYQKLREENSALDTKLKNTSFANNDLHRQIFELKQQRRRVANLLGFDDLDSAEAKITTKDPWVPGGYNRILALEKTIAEQLDFTKAVQAERMEMDLSLGEEREDALRLRQQRDSARQEAEKQAGDCGKFRDELQVSRDDLQKCRDDLQRCHEEVDFWKDEVKKNLPEMQALIREQQTTNTTESAVSPQVKTGNEPLKGVDQCLSPLRNVVNTSSSAVVGCSSQLDSDSGIQVQYHKERYALLEAKYNELLAAKNKVSKKYFEDLKKWKEFKEWVVKEEPGIGSSKRRAIRRRKALEDICPRGVSSASRLEDAPMPLSPTKGRTVGGPEDTLLNLSHQPMKTVEADFQTRARLAIEDLSCALSPPTLRVSSPSPASLAESLTQMSSLPPAAPDDPPSTPISRPLTINKLPEQPSFSQESVTQPSSTPPSPVNGPSAIHEKGGLPSQFNATNTPPDKILAVARDSEKLPHLRGLSKNDSILAPVDATNNTSQKQGDGFPDTSSKFRRNIERAGHETPTVLSDACDKPKKLLADLPSMAPARDVQRTIFPDADTQIPRSEIRRTSSGVLAMDTPPRASALVRHHSSPPDSPYVTPIASSPSTMGKRKRKVVDIEDAHDDDANQGTRSDPFVVGPSPAKLATINSREHRAIHPKVLGKQSHKQYMAEYMQYKGRGRYSNVKGLPDKTVNAEFEIDPARNGGVDYQFDAVVRDKAGRKNLEAGDCECCREYYEAVGPLPPRLQPPKWKSPSRSQEARPSRPCRHENKVAGRDSTLTPSATARAKAIKSHKHDISRHRHDWAPPTTPPSYWQIGFPDTQEVEDINRQANDMHARKLQRVEADVSSNNGRYRRRE